MSTPINKKKQNKKGQAKASLTQLMRKYLIFVVNKKRSRNEDIIKTLGA